MRSSRKILLIVAMLSPTLLAFQNCSINAGGYQSNKSQSSKVNGNGNNGEGYTGKVYVNYDVASTCASGDVKNQIELKDGKYLQTVKDCQAVSPVDVTSQVQAKSYNGSAIFEGPLLYESLSTQQTVYSEVVCRGDSMDSSNPRKGMADVSMQPTGDVQKNQNGDIIGKIYKGYVKVGEYDSSGNLISSKEFQIAKAVEHTILNGARLFAIDSPTSNDPVPKAAPGEPPSLPLENYGLMITADGRAAFNFKTEDMAQGMMVPQMDCHFHSN